MFAPPMTITIFPLAAARACSSARSMPSVTNAYEVPPCRSKRTPGRCETTKQGQWNVGLSPQGPTPDVEHAAAHDDGAGMRERLDLEGLHLLRGPVGKHPRVET